MVYDPAYDELDPYAAWARAQQAGAAPPMPPQALAAPAPPTPEELPMGTGAIEPPLSPDEEQQIELDPSAAPQGAPPPGTDQPQLDVDATTGADPMTGIADRSDVDVSYEPHTEAPQTPDAYLEHMTALAGEQPLPSMRENMIGDATTKAVDAMTPEQFTQYQADRQSKMLLEKARLEHEAVAENERRARENLEIQRAATAKADADTKDMLAQANQLAQVHINPDRYKQTRGSFGALKDITGVLFMGLGGDVQGGLKVLDQRIARDIAAQQSDLENGWRGIGAQKGAIADELARHGDLYRAQETYRIAAYQAQINDIDSQLQLYDPAGSTAIRGRQAREQLKAAQQQSLLAFNQKQFDNHLRTLTVATNVDRQLLAREKQEAELRAKGAGGAGVKQSPEFWEAYGGMRPPMPMTQKEYEQWLGTKGKVKALNKPDTEKSAAQIRKEDAEAQKAEAEAEAAKTGFALKNPETGEVFKNPDGSPVVEMDATKRNRASGIIEAATNIRRVADRMSAILEKHHGVIKGLGSDEAQEIQNLTSMLDFETFKAFDLGAPSEGDKALAEGVRGGADPTSFIKNATKGFQAYADNVEKKANTALRNSGYKGPTLRFHRESDVKQAPSNVVDEIGQKLTTALYSSDAANVATNPFAGQGAKVMADIHLRANKTADEDLNKLAAYAEVPNDMGDLAKKYLREVAANAVYPDLAAKAAHILDTLPGAHPRTQGAR